MAECLSETGSSHVSPLLPVTGSGSLKLPETDRGQPRHLPVSGAEKSPEETMFCGQRFGNLNPCSHTQTVVWIQSIH